jgi:hypothetical protein
VSYHSPIIVDCACGLRYMRTAIRSDLDEMGHFRCTCGQVIGAWNGPYRLDFEPEEEPED